LEEIGSSRVHVLNPDALDGVVHTADNEIAAEGLAQTDFGSSSAFVKNATDVVQFAVVEVLLELQFLIEQPGFHKGQLIILQARTGLSAQSNLLAAPLEEWRIEQIKIALGEFHEGHQVFDGVETCTDHEITGVSFFHRYHHVFPVRNVGGFDGEIHFFEVIQTFQALLAQFGPDHVERFSGSNRQFATQDLVFGLGVSSDLDFLDVGAVAFLDLVIQVDGSFFGVGGFDFPNAGVSLVAGGEVPFGFV